MTEPRDIPLGDLVADDARRAELFDRLGLDYCCGGDRTLDEACRDRGLEPSTVIAALEALDAAAGTTEPEADWRERPLAELIDHIVDTHHAYMQRELPRLTTLLDRVAKVHGDEHAWLHEARELFGGLRRELVAHTETEETTIFPLIRSLEAGGVPPDAPEVEALLDEAEAEHDEAGAALDRLRALSDGFTPPDGACGSFRSLLDGLESLESDMHRHVHKENSILFPRVRHLAADTTAATG